MTNKARTVSPKSILSVLDVMQGRNATVIAQELGQGPWAVSTIRNVLKQLEVEGRVYMRREQQSAYDRHMTNRWFLKEQLTNQKEAI